MKALASEMGIGEHAIRKDLDALLAKDVEPRPCLPAALSSALRGANTCEALLAVESLLITEVAEGRVASSDGVFFLAACREVRQTLKGVAREKKAKREDRSEGDILAEALLHCPLPSEPRARSGDFDDELADGEPTSSPKNGGGP